jgi:hypothetical protein
MAEIVSNNKFWLFTNFDSILFGFVVFGIDFCIFRYMGNVSIFYGFD